MNRVRGSLVSCLVIGSMLVGSCTIRLGAETSGTTEPGSFHREDLDAIVLRASDAPDGTGYAQRFSGFQDLDAFARDAQERTDLIEDGFVVGHLALFGPAGWTGPGSGELPLDAPFAQGITGLFETADGADTAYRRFGEDLRTRQFERVRDLPAPLLGQESFALEGTSGGSHLVIYVWREDNLILAVSGSGVLDTRDVASLAELVRRRTVA
jgi:hypothetical protein